MNTRRGVTRSLWLKYQPSVSVKFKSPRPPSTHRSDKLYKGRSQEKTLLRRLEFFVLRSPVDEAGSVLVRRTMGSVCRTQRPAVWVSLSAVFINCSRRSLSVPKQAKQNGGQVGDHGSIGDSWPMAFSGCPRGPRVRWETAGPRCVVPS